MFSTVQNTAVSVAQRSETRVGDPCLRQRVRHFCEQSIVVMVLIEMTSVNSVERGLTEFVLSLKRKMLAVYNCMARLLVSILMVAVDV